MPAVIHGGYYPAFGKNKRSRFKANKNVQVPGISRKLVTQLKEKHNNRNLGRLFTLSHAGKLAGFGSQLGGKNYRENDLSDEMLAMTVAFQYAKGKQREANLFKLKKFINDTPRKYKLQGQAVWWGQISNTEDEIAEMLANNETSYKTFKSDWDNRAGKLADAENVLEWARQMGLMGTIDEEAFNKIDSDAEADASEEVPLDMDDVQMEKPYSVAEWSKANRLDARLKIGDKEILVDTTERKLQDVRFGPHHGSGKEAYTQDNDSYEHVKKNKAKIKKDVATYFETKAFGELNKEIQAIKKKALKRKGVDKRNLKASDLVKTYDKGSRGQPSTSAAAYHRQAMKNETKKESKKILDESQIQFIFHSLGNEAYKVRRDFRNVFRVSDRQPSTGAAYYASVPTKMFGRNHARRFEYDETAAQDTAIIRGASGVHAIMVQEKATRVGLQGKHANTQFKMYSAMTAAQGEGITKGDGFVMSGINSTSTMGFVKTTISYSPKRMNKFLKLIEKNITDEWIKKAEKLSIDVRKNARKVGNSGIFWAMPYIGVDVDRKRTK